MWQYSASQINTSLGTERQCKITRDGSQEGQKQVNGSPRHRLFDDCDRGAVPPLGPAYGIETLLDSTLTSLADVYFEAGDHEHLVHLNGEEFQSLLSAARRSYYSRESRTV